MLWAASEQVPLDLNSILFENQLESALGFLRALSFEFHLEFNSKPNRICSGLPQSSFLSFLIKVKFKIRVQLKINEDLLWAASEQLLFIFNYSLLESQSESALAALEQFPLMLN